MGLTFNFYITIYFIIQRIFLYVISQKEFWILFLIPICMQAIYYNFRKQFFNIKIKTEILERKFPSVSTVEIKYIT